LRRSSLRTNQPPQVNEHGQLGFTYRTHSWRMSGEVERVRERPARKSFLRSGLEGKGFPGRLETMRNGWSWFAISAPAGELHERGFAFLSRGPFDGSDGVRAIA
jgi:hypothetical protein